MSVKISPEERRLRHWARNSPTGALYIYLQQDDVAGRTAAKLKHVYYYNPQHNAATRELRIRGHKP